MVIGRKCRPTEIGNLRQWLDQRLTVQRDQSPIAQDSGTDQPARDYPTLPKYREKAEEVQSTELEPMRDEWEIFTEWNGLAGPRVGAPGEGAYTKVRYWRSFAVKTAS